MKTTWYFLPVMICLVLCACQAPVLLSTVGSSSLKMTFLVSGSRDTTLPSAKVAASGSRLLLPTIVSLTVSLTPQDPSLPAIAPKTQTFPAGTVPNQITMVFPNVANGTYTISAEATDNSNNTFRQTSLTNIGENTSSVTLNLIPTNSTGLTQLSFGPTYSGSLTTLQSISFTVPASSLTTSLGNLCFD